MDGITTKGTKAFSFPRATVRVLRGEFHRFSRDKSEYQMKERQPAKTPTKNSAVVGIMASTADKNEQRELPANLLPKALL